MNKVKKAITTVVFGAGIVAVLFGVVLITVQSHIILFPKAMLPMELRELASIWLAVGFIPMLTASISFYKVHDISNRKHKKRNMVLVYIPAFVCLLCIIFWICVLVGACLKIHSPNLHAPLCRRFAPNEFKKG